MSENDYIAEYIKEKHPGLLGFDFALWKAVKKVIEIGNAIAEVFRNIDIEDLKKTEEFKDIMREDLMEDDRK